MWHSLRKNLAIQLIFIKIKKINLEKFKTTDKKLNTEGILISSANTIKKLSIKFSQNKLAGLIIVGDDSKH